MSGHDFPTLLRTHGLRATEGRTGLLKALAREQYPVTVETLHERTGGRLDLATLYRALEALVAAKIVARIDLQHGHAHYELLAGRPHHHHAICRSCSIIEDIEVPHAPHPERVALRQTKRFASIDTYQLDFFGLCNNCAS